MDTRDIFKAVKTYLRDHFPGMTATALDIEATDARGPRRISLPVPVLPQRRQKPREFIPGPVQEDILDALDCVAMKTAELAAKVGGKDKLFRRPGGIQELKALGLVVLDSKVGYYRPDAPPPGVTLPEDEE